MIKGRWTVWLITSLYFILSKEMMKIRPCQAQKLIKYGQYVVKWIPEMYESNESKLTLEVSPINDIDQLVKPGGNHRLDSLTWQGLQKHKH